MPRNGSGSYNLPNGPFVPSTVISSTVMNQNLSDLGTAITQSIANDGQTTPVANLPMATFRHTNVGNAVARNDYAAAGQVQDSSLQWLTSVAGTNTITAAITPSPTAYTAGQTFRFTAAGANTGATTLNINGLGAKDITKNGTTALVADDIPSGAVIEVVYDGTQFQLRGVAFPSAAVGNSPFSWRNKLINALGSINQRLYISGTATTIANQYTLDRWRVVTSGQNLTFAANANGFTFTAPAGGVEQVIESVNIEGGTYYINWTGTATATVNGVAVTKGVGFALPANTNATVRFTSGTFFQPQLEIGGVTPFEQRHNATELDICQRYYWQHPVVANCPVGTGQATASGTAFCFTRFPRSMRVAPTVSYPASMFRLGGEVVGAPVQDSVSVDNVLFHVAPSTTFTTGFAVMLLSGPAPTLPAIVANAEL